MNKRAHKNSNKCIKKLLRHILTICIKHYFVSYCPPNTHFPKPNSTLLQYLRKNSYNTETTQLIYKARPLIGFYVIQVFTEGYFGTDQNTLFFYRNQSLLLLYLLFKTVGPHIPLILFLLTKCIKSVYSKHSKNTKSCSYTTYSSLGEKMLLGI